MYSTASEVAVLNYGKYLLEFGQSLMLIERQCPQLELIQPSRFLRYWPGILMLSNPVGAEYIVMEKVPGVQIFRVWDEMDESNRISIIKRLTQWESELAAIHFPAYGNLYYKSSLHEADMVPLDSVSAAPTDAVAVLWRWRILV
jgi:hypothetical protein